MLTAVVVVPSTPLVLAGHPGKQHDAISELARQIDRAASELAGCETVVILAGGPQGSGIRVRAHSQVDVSGSAMRQGYGIGPPSPDTGRTAASAAPAPAADRIAAAARIIRRRSTRAVDAAVDGVAGWADADVLAVHVAQVAPDSTLVIVSVGADIQPDDAREFAATLAPGTGSRTGLLVAGDLSAGHGNKPPRPGATIVFDDQILGALDSGQPDRLLRVSEELATGSQSRAAGALRVLGAVLADTAMGMVVRWSGAPLGVGYVVAVGR